LLRPGNVAIMARLLYNAQHILRYREIAIMPLQIDIPHDEIAAFCQRWRIRELAIFGSALRDDFRPDSDVDVLVVFEPGMRIGLIGFARMENELSHILKRRVDLNTPNSLSRRFRGEVLPEAKVVYAQT
jgi:predicted nucleotidyltransferase